VVLNAPSTQNSGWNSFGFGQKIFVRLFPVRQQLNFIYSNTRQ
jgi:hypothetical protein